MSTPQGAGPCRIEVHIPDSSPWQGDDHRWHAALHFRLFNGTDRPIESGWQLRLKVPEAAGVDQAWCWRVKLSDGGQLTGTAAEAFSAIAPGAEVEVGTVLLLSKGAVHVADAELNAAPCSLNGRLEATAAA